jgi:carboxymethylenebutenolidase
VQKGFNAAQDWAKARLDALPRHLEWVKVQHGPRKVNCFLAFPERKDKATAVMVGHEIFGRSDWVRSVTDQLAEAGHLAIAPDLLFGMTPGGGGTDEVRKAIGALPPDQVTADLQAGTERFTVHRAGHRSLARAKLFPGLRVDAADWPTDP